MSTTCLQSKWSPCRGQTISDGFLRLLGFKGSKTFVITKSYAFKKVRSPLTYGFCFAQCPALCGCYMGIVRHCGHNAITKSCDPFWISARAVHRPHWLRTCPSRLSWKPYCECTVISQFLCNFRKVSVQICCDFPGKIVR